MIEERERIYDEMGKDLQKWSNLRQLNILKDEDLNMISNNYINFK